MYVQGAEAWAADILRQDLVDSPDSDHLGEQWAIELPPLPVDGGTITGKLEDLQGRFNLNNLIGGRRHGEPARAPPVRAASEQRRDRPRRSPAPSSIGSTPIPSCVSRPAARTSSTAARIRPTGRRTAMITSASELMAIAGFDRESYQRLAPYVTVLPRGTKLNVNTASDVVLASLSDNIDIGTAGSLGRGARRTPSSSTSTRRSQGLVEPDVLARDRRRQRAFFVDRNGDARVKSAHDALGAAARSERNHAGAVPQSRSRVAWLKRCSFVWPTPGLQPGVRSTPRGGSSAALGRGTLQAAHAALAGRRCTALVDSVDVLVARSRAAGREPSAPAPDRRRSRSRNRWPTTSTRWCSRSARGCRRERRRSRPSRKERMDAWLARVARRGHRAACVVLRGRRHSGHSGDARAPHRRRANRRPQAWSGPVRVRGSRRSTQVLSLVLARKPDEPELRHVQRVHRRRGPRAFRATSSRCSPASSRAPTSRF